MKAYVNVAFPIFFACFYLLVTHFFLHKYTEWITQLNYGLIIGALFWIMLNLHKQK